ncbi:hypothetical protein EVB94_343 [Rhizobium phage RHph_TM40]|uniref:Uncharacterized protein n=2 Tax=Cuauhnahuacvirus TaxID=3044696 RepID=A0A7S5RDR4_9CAUD|nr:hypothetical protein PQC16_gp318 [Rhizobium phage RHph_TM30]YP_010671471.1 hypothetical protein PQC17_gp319 [Rhizobium phage RHph_Y65]QIG71794.1 hypothetical protein EVB94_343 [Rhizobium phage RHph_TM40]QIG72155.1 hypothetical protein EVB95_341 [Rhizobium phage RHph_TM2_3B]QIG72517.1 hypothetical protein EVB96_341 [Rhizobium phage RHph_TM3_3_6]QIG71430.1 hypothetical protein EVB93_343 [Rhizobium phage RHph_TM30]QIG72880.1 hypothetical protein EVB97_342 [Rhizobium phage RHph_Y65]
MDDALFNLIHDISGWMSERAFSLVVVLVVAIMVILKLHSSRKYPNIDLTDLIVDPQDNKLSGSKIRMLLATVVSTWAFIFLVLNDKLTEWFMTIYMSIFMVEVLGKKYLDFRGSPTDEYTSNPSDKQSN